MFQSILTKGEKVPFSIHPDPHRCWRKELGIASIQLGSTVFPTCTFFQMTEPNMNDIIFNFFTNSSTFYCFPREVLTDCLTETAPHKVIFSSLSPSSDQHVMLSNVSQKLFQAIRNLVSPYEAMCQNIMALCKQHDERVAYYKSKIAAMLPETLYPDQSENPHQDDSSTISSFDDAYEEERKIMKQTGNKKCLYCGSKSTPMWRRGPQGAGTLCNACGVKWKHGKILNGNESNTGKKRKRSNSSSSSRKRKQVSETSSSSTSDSPSLDSSPNTSPSLDLKKYQMTYLMDFEGNEILEDAVEAATLLTLLKRS